MEYWYLLIFIFFSINSYAELSPPQIISLVPPGAYKVLEMQNTLHNKCVKKKNEEREKCFSDVRKSKDLKPKEWHLTAYKNTTLKSKKIGTIRIVATPGKGLVAYFKNDKKFEISLPSDSKNTDWGYGNFFEFTVQKVKGDWIQLPKRPFKTPIWINLKNDWRVNGLPVPKELSTDNIYSSAIGDIVITKFMKSSFSYRLENSNDMPCGDEPVKVSPEKLKIHTHTINKLYDSDGHLTAWTKYTRGC